jgi:hypothetical protein
MKRFTIRAAAVAFLTLPHAGAAQELPPLGQVPSIWEGLVQTALAYEIGDKCGSLDARIGQGWLYLLSLQATARDLGYSQEEVEAFVDDEAEQDRLEAEARARLATLGVVEGQEETYCAIGRAEIAKGSLAGRFLRG